MPLGNQSLTDISREQAETEPGMAFFAGTGPRGKRCMECSFKGYSYVGSKSIRRSNGCRKAYELRGGDKPTPDISDRNRACKYFVQSEL